MKKYLLVFSFVTLLTSYVSAQISFNYSQSNNCSPSYVEFYNSSSSGVHFDWYYGDGQYAFDTYNTAHTYVGAGNYTVYLDAYDASYNYLGSYSQVITVNGPTSYIPKSASEICPNDPVSFSVYANANQFEWEFSDGYTETENNGYINHEFTISGWNYIWVSYYDLDCGQYYTIQDSVFVNPSMPWFNGYPGLSVNTTNACPGVELWMDINGPQYQVYDWNFGDGNTASGNYQNHVYSSMGAYTISVYLENGCGVDTTLYQMVNIDNSIPAPTVTIDGPDQVCPGEQVYFTGYAYEPLIYTWNFGDGSPTETSDYPYIYHAFPTNGLFTVQLTVENLCGNTSTSFFTVEGTASAPLFDPYFDVNPQVVCPGDLINYWAPWNYSTYVEFGDGSFATEGYDHVYTNPGTYNIMAVLQNTCGMTDTLYQTVVVTNSAPFSTNVWAGASPNEACPGQDMEFSATGGFSDYTWNFGDGNTSNYSNALHEYTFSGNYNASVTITNGCGNDSTLYFTTYVSNNLPINNLDWYVSGTTICAGTELYFAVDNDDEDYDITWNFGDGSQTSNNNLETHIFNLPGTYSVTLNAVNNCGNDSTVTTNITVGTGIFPDLSQMEFGVQTPGCVGDNLYFAVIPAGMGTYSWDFGDGNTGLSDQLVIVEDPIEVGFHAYSNPGTYFATLTVTNTCGLSADSTIEVNISGYGDINATADVFFWYDQQENICEGQPVTFFAVGAGTYIWDFGDGTGSLITYTSLEPVEHIYTNDGFYQVTVVGVNGCGNTGDNDEDIFIPNSDISVVTNTVIDADCGENNGVAVVSATGGAQPYTFNWTNGDQGTIADSLGSGIYTVLVTDNNGCQTETLASVSDDQGPVILLQNIVNNDCFGQDNGVIAVSIFGGSPPYEVLWSNGATSEDIYNLEAGQYEVYVTDANGCFAAESFTVQSPPQSIVSVLTQPASCGLNNGQATATVSNATAPLNFIWPNASGSSNFTGGLAAGVYDVMVIDGNTCLHQTTFTVSEAFGPVIVTDSITDPTCSGDLSAIYISTIGGVAPFTYAWSNSTSSQDLTGVLPGEYYVEVIGGNGCSSFKYFNVEMTAPDEPEICIVTVDTLSDSNLIVWNKVNSPDVVSYRIYKESSLNGVYFLVATQSADSLSQYFDYPSNPAIKSWRYKVSAVDDCGNESELSEPHKTIHLTSNQGISGEVNLIWDHYNGFNYSTYYIHRYHPTTGWMIIDSVGSNAISYTDLTPPGDSSLVYMIGINPPSTCTATKAQDHNSSRSNKSSINMPDNGGGGLGIESISNNDLSIYPNPTNGILNISYGSVIYEVSVFDLSGQLIMKKSNNTNQLMLNFDELADGIYTIQLNTENGILHSKFVKQ